MKIDIEKLIKDSFIENFNYDDFLDSLSEDIHSSNPDWWAKVVVEPLKETLQTAILNNKDLIQNVIENVIDYDFAYDKLQALMEEKLKERIDNLMPKIKIKLEIEENE